MQLHNYAAFLHSGSIPTSLEDDVCRLQQRALQQQSEEEV